MAESTDDDDLRDVVEQLASSIAGGSTLDGAIRRLQRWIPEEMLRAARVEYERRVGIIRDIPDPRVIKDPAAQDGWYAGPSDRDRFWPPLRTRLLGDLGEGAIKKIDANSSRVVGLLEPPGATTIATRGLVLGYVQSGKTTSFMSVIAKSADQGYRLFIVLSGITENLRAQTQERLQEQLIADQDASWFLLTRIDSDFTSPGNATNLLQNQNHRLLAVIKKNPYRLRRLVEWLNSAAHRVRETCPILLVDDEADQASIDVGRNGRTSRINGLIRQVLRQPKSAYVAYTATPFANMLIEPSNFEGLYPRTFIAELDKPEEYFGAERIFGRDRLNPDDPDDLSDGLNIVREIPDTEIAALRPPGRAQMAGWEPGLTPSLQDAIRWFLLATTARRVRGRGNRHSSMLVHTSMLSQAHFMTAALIRDHLRLVAAGLAAGDRDLVGAFKQQWDSETGLVPAATFGEQPVPWGEVSARLAETAGATSIVVDNYLSTERLSYSHDAPAVTAIVIGGNTLSRGLTLEGLVNSYFVRSATAYDTLLQMGRWFGFRNGYADLVRVWMTEELKSWFLDLATVEEEIRQQIRRYAHEKLTPLKLSTKIRTHPAMTITAAAKMRAARPSRLNYGGGVEQTILFQQDDRDWLLHNQDAARRFLNALKTAGLDATAGRAGRPVVRGADAEQVITFLNDYRFLAAATRLRGDLLTTYIRGQNNHGFLRQWNVVIMGSARPAGGDGTIDLGAGPVRLITRSRMDLPSLPHANIKALVSTVDRVADLEFGDRRLTDLLGRDPSDLELLGYREDVVGDTGLIGLYPIRRDSAPDPNRRPSKPGTKPRVPLEAIEHVIGVGIFFPRARGADDNDYVAVDVEGLAAMFNPDEYDDIDDIDDTDERSEQAAGGSA